MMARPSPSDYPPFYEAYVRLVQEADIQEVIAASLIEINHFLSGIPEEKAEYSYSEGKWTVRQLLQHCIDAERIFCFRALSFARGEKQTLPGFEENDYANMADASQRSLEDLKRELMLVRQSSVELVRSFTADMLSRKGIANGKEISVLALSFIIIGHFRHHINVLRERYL